MSDENSENNSPLTSDVPPDFDFIASKTEDERVAYINEILAHDEEQALTVIKPVFGIVRNAVEVFSIYKPMIVVLREHFCHPGRPKQGKKTWREICEEFLGVSIRRVQQLLAAPKELLTAPKPQPIESFQAEPSEAVEPTTEEQETDSEPEPLVPEPLDSSEAELPHAWETSAESEPVPEFVEFDPTLHELSWCLDGDADWKPEEQPSELVWAEAYLEHLEIRLEHAKNEVHRLRHELKDAERNVELLKSSQRPLFRIANKTLPSSASKRLAISTVEKDVA
jgi:hypothetical protein